METEIIVLATGTASAALLHTLLGVDHYLPLAALARQRRMSLHGVMILGAAAGGAHIGVSLLIAAALLAVNMNLAADGQHGLAAISDTQLALAAGLLIAIGGAMMARDFCFWRAGTPPARSHAARRWRGASMLAVFAALALGPCEPLLALALYPMLPGVAALGWLLALFAAVTMLTMMAALVVARMGLNHLRWPAAERFRGAVIGAVALSSGAAMLLLRHGH